MTSKFSFFCCRETWGRMLRGSSLDWSLMLVRSINFFIKFDWCKDLSKHSTGFSFTLYYVLHFCSEMACQLSACFKKVLFDAILQCLIRKLIGLAYFIWLSSTKAVDLMQILDSPSELLNTCYFDLDEGFLGWMIYSIVFIIFFAVQAKWLSWFPRILRTWGNAMR